MKTQEKEFLLGYLLNALDEHEATQVKQELSRDPRLRAELATLQREIAPLDYISDSVEPPPGLASRTCAKIWSVLDADEKEAQEQDYTPNSDTFMNSAFFSPESMLPPSFLLQASEPEKPEREKVEQERPRARKRFDEIEDEDAPPRPSRIGLIASVSVGIVIACFLFPVIRFAERSTRSYVTDSWRNEINQRVWQYEQIYGGTVGTPVVEEIVPYDLTLSDWQEVKMPPSRMKDISRVDASVVPSAGTSFDDMVHWHFNNENHSSALHSPRGVNPSVREQQPILLPEFEGWSEPIPSDTSGMSDPILLVTPGRGSPVRSAFGQVLRFQDGRVFSRILPSEESAGD